MLAGSNPEPRGVQKSKDEFTYPLGKYLLLPAVDEKVSVDFFEVVSNRKSERAFNELSLQQISNLLWHCAKVRKTFLAENGVILSSRPSPSAGAIHPIDILVSLGGSNLIKSFYYYDPFQHRLYELQIETAYFDNFLNHVDQCLNGKKATLFWFVASPRRTSEKYMNCESLVWRDAGALIMIFQLVATAFNIKSCPVGTLGEPFVSELFGGELISAGGILVG